MGHLAGRPCGMAGSRSRPYSKGSILPLKFYSSRNLWVLVRCLSWVGNRTDTEDKHKAPTTAPHRPLSLRRWQPGSLHLVLMESPGSGSMRRWDALCETEKVTRIIHRLNAL